MKQQRERAGAMSTILQNMMLQGHPLVATPTTTASLLVSLSIAKSTPLEAQSQLMPAVTKECRIRISQLLPMLFQRSLPSRPSRIQTTTPGKHARICYILQRWYTTT